MRKHLDHQPRLDLQLGMRPLEGQSRQRIAKRIQRVLALTGRRQDFHLVVQTTLAGACTRPQMRQLLGQRHRRGIPVVGVVEYLVTLAFAHVHLSRKAFAG